MAQYYPRPPITEAIIDLRVKLADDFELQKLRQPGNVNQAAYPISEEIVEAVRQMEFGPGDTSASVRKRAIGVKSISADGKQIVQSRQNGFTFSRLAPYDRWETFQEEARRLWATYRAATNPSEITRLAVRYINRVDIPGRSVNLKDYFRTSPEVAKELPQLLDGFFMQVRLPFPEINSIAVLNQTTVPPIREGVVSVVLDVDLFRLHEPPQDDDGIWQVFEQFHQEKNRIFESCITDSTRRLFSECQS